MERIIAIANQKGGVGKTTTTVNLSASLAAKGKKVLVIDMDPQGNATSGFGVDKNSVENTIYELMLGDCSAKESIVADVVPNVSLIPSNVNLSGAEVELLRVENREYVVRDEIEWIKDEYDFIIIDCPPSLNILTVNAMTTANSVLVPVQCEFYALEGISQLIYTINLIKERLSPDLGIEGVLFTMYNSRNKLDRDVVNNVTEVLSGYNYRIFDTLIPRNVRLAEAPSVGQPINLYDKRSAGAEAYLKLAEEIIG